MPENHIKINYLLKINIERREQIEDQQDQFLQVSLELNLS